MTLVTNVLVVGAGPSGLMTALTLSSNGIRCTIVERNQSSTQWPKMDLTNCRSMELLRKLGVAEGWRKIGVPGEFSLDVLFSTGLGKDGETFAKWTLPSPDAWAERIRKVNDGSQPLEQWQRGSQSLFEAYLREKLEADPLVDISYGVRFESLRETERGVESTLTDEAGAAFTIQSRYVLGCDGGGSRVRRSLGIELDGGPVPSTMYLIHFKSRDLDVLHRQGQFWHIFFAHGRVLVSQDEKDTFTMHTPVPVDTDVSKLDPYETISKGIAGILGTEVPIKIDEIIVASTWRPTVALAKKYASSDERVCLVGDSAHQTVPAGGYGMNTALGDSYDIGWKMAAVLKGYAGPALLASYEVERRPVADHNLKQARKHWEVHATYRKMVNEAGEGAFQCAEEAKKQTRQYLETNGFENLDFGTELDYRYRSSPVITKDETAEEPHWDRSKYTPSTWPGMRVPSVWLKDGGRNIHHLLGTGPEFAIVDFSRDGKHAETFVEEAKKLGIPLKSVHLPEEDHIRSVWERDAVLIRPDDFVAWRLPSNASSSLRAEEAKSALEVAVGRFSARKH